MSRKRHFFKWATSVIALSVLAACGGGGSSTVIVVSDPIDMYTGRWGSDCVLLVGGYSTQYVYTIDRWNATTAIGAFQGYGYNNPTCSGNGYVVDTAYNHAFTAQIVGEKVVQGRLANKMIYQFSGGTINDVWFTDGVTFMNGSTYSGYDGFPDSFASMTFLRR